MSLSNEADSDEEAVEEAPKKKGPRVYAGHQVPVGELKLDPGEYKIVQVPPDVRKNDVRQKLPLFMVIERVQPGIDRGSKAITYKDPRNGFLARTVYLKQDVPINVLNGRQGDKLKAEWLEYQSNRAAPVYPMSIGSDPEIFVEDKDGEIIPAWVYLGSKAKPNKGHTQAENGHNNVYWDGFQAEFDTRPNMRCLAYLVDEIHYGLKAVLQAARLKDKHAKLSNAAVLPIPNNMLEEAKEEHVQFGCMPSKNIYKLEGRKEDGRAVPYRFAGGHLHFGFDGGTPKPELTARIIKALDAIAGVACVSMFAEYDSPVRREYYGLAGEYRTPKHGLEYRTLSNAWLMHPLLMNMVFDLSRRAVHYAIENMDNWKATEEEVIMTIQTCDVDRARAILKTNEKVLARMMEAVYIGGGELFANLTQRGIETFINKPADLEGNWHLTNGLWLTHNESPQRNWVKSRETLTAGGKV